MSIEELLDELNIDKEPIENENGSYTIDLDSSNEFAKYSSKLDKSDLLEEDQEASNIGLETSSVQYVSDDFTVTMLANFETEEYKMIIREM